MSSDGQVTQEGKGHVLLMGIDRGSKMNAFDPAMLESLSQAFTELEHNDRYRCGVLFAHGEHFTAGLDLQKVAPLIAQGKGLGLGDSSDGNTRIDPWGVHGAQRTKPVVCAVHGRCLTLGIELVLALDITVAADDTRFAQIEVKRGIFPFGGATTRFVERSGWGNAMRYLLTGDEFSAEEALRIGLVQEVVPRGKQLERAVALAETVAAQAPLGVQATLRSARQTLDAGPSEAARALLPEIIRLMATDDAREGLMSFIERRSASFTGK